MAREMGVVGISQFSKTEMLKRVEEKLEEVRRKDDIYFEVEEPKRALRKAMTTWKFNPLIQTDVQTFQEKTTPKRKEIIEGLRKKRAKVEVVLKILFVKMNPTGTRENDEKVGYFSSGYKVMNR